MKQALLGKENNERVYVDVARLFNHHALAVSVSAVRMGIGESEFKKEIKMELEIHAMLFELKELAIRKLIKANAPIPPPTHLGIWADDKGNTILVDVENFSCCIHSKLLSFDKPRYENMGNVIIVNAMDSDGKTAIPAVALIFNSTNPDVITIDIPDDNPSFGAILPKRYTFQRYHVDPASPIKK